MEVLYTQKNHCQWHQGFLFNRYVCTILILLFIWLYNDVFMMCIFIWVWFSQHLTTFINYLVVFLSIVLLVLSFLLFYFFLSSFLAASSFAAAPFLSASFLAFFFFSSSSSSSGSGSYLKQYERCYIFRLHHFNKLWQYWRKYNL